jgi:hypothetical protein
MSPDAAAEGSENGAGAAPGEGIALHTTFVIT